MARKATSSRGIGPAGGDPGSDSSPHAATRTVTVQVVQMPRKPVIVHLIEGPVPPPAALSRTETAFERSLRERAERARPPVDVSAEVPEVTLTRKSIEVEASEEWQVWLRELAGHCGLTLGETLRQSLRDFAEEKGFFRGPKS